MSKYHQYKDKKAVYPHKHCPICSNMVSEEGGLYNEYCSAECANHNKGEKKSKRKRTFIFVGIYAVMIIVFVVFFLLNN